MTYLQEADFAPSTFESNMDRNVMVPKTAMTAMYIIASFLWSCSPKYVADIEVAEMLQTIPR